MIDFHVVMNAIHDGTAPSSALAGVDLNLLVAFDALARERSVTRAAERVGITQSAMSHALRRLRTLFDDPLLVRSSRGMVLTPRAEALVPPLRSGLATLGRALTEPNVFDPATAQRAFSIASPDLFDILVIPPLLARTRQDAPGVDLRVLPLDDRRVSDRLEAGELDAAVVPHIDESRSRSAPPRVPGLVQRRLFRDRFICLLRADHAALRASGKRSRANELSLDAYCELSHILVSPRGEGPSFVDQLLGKRSRTRRIALRIPAFYSALRIVANSDLILTGPAALATFAPADGSVVSLAAPFALPTHAINLIWHERFSKDPGHSWLRAMLASTAEQAMRDVDQGR